MSIEVLISEAGPRDELQSVNALIATADKVAWIHALRDAVQFDELAAPHRELDPDGAQRCRWPRFAPEPGRGAQPANAAAERLLRDLSPTETADLRTHLERAATSDRPTRWHAFTACVAQNRGRSIVQLAPMPSATGTARALGRAHVTTAGAALSSSCVEGTLAQRLKER